jgi:uncharacterized membrane protein YgcG
MKFSELHLEDGSNITHLSDALLVTREVRYVRSVRRSEAFALMKEAMAMRAGRSRKRPGKRFVRNLIWVLVAYVPFAALLVLGSDTTLGGVLVFGGIVVPVVAAFVTVVMFKADASDEASEVPPAVYNPGGNHGAIGGGHHGGGSWDGGGIGSGGFDGGGDGGGGSR